MFLVSFMIRKITSPNVCSSPRRSAAWLDYSSVIIRPGHLSLRLQRLPACASLVELDLAYIWQTSSRQTNVNASPLADPFAQNLSLPYQTLLDDVVEQFVNRDFVKCVSMTFCDCALTYYYNRRYPLIFGPWRRVTLLFSSGVIHSFDHN